MTGRRSLFRSNLAKPGRLTKSRDNGHEVPATMAKDYGQASGQQEAEKWTLPLTRDCEKDLWALGYFQLKRAVEGGDRGT
ncbi:hypothetical protein RRG08_029863 [Elysia crispata]|uniref:Uncharacterized protein n=1 Tax=Elysia crispata TaxID=231223 RepID=A0AAE0YJM9_9GAST|nr:hypothetical protein RRG08_029863 [Elysia crispata]